MVVYKGKEMQSKEFRTLLTEELSGIHKKNYMYDKNSKTNQAKMFDLKSL